MSNLPRPILNRIPGSSMPLVKQEQNIKDLTKLSLVELLEIKERESKLLVNKTKLQRLPDKGKRIQDFYDKVLAELERRSNLNEVASMFSELNIAAKGEKALNQLEWNGRLNGEDLTNAVDPIEDVLDSDDETEMDPLRLIAQRTMHERRIKILPPEPQLITSVDLEEIKSFSADSPDSGLSNETLENEEAIGAQLQENNQLSPVLASSASSTAKSGSNAPVQEVEQHVRYLVEKTENLGIAPKEKFRPYKTTISDVHAPEKERLRKQGKHWEVTAATPPLIQHGGTKLLTLLDSVELQTSYLSKLKELQEKQAVDRLAAKLERLEQRKLQLPADEELKTKTTFTAYRPTRNLIEGEQYYSEVDEVHDPLDEERAGGGITYPIID